LTVVAEEYEALIESVYAGPLVQLIERLEAGRSSSDSDTPAAFEYGMAGSTIVLAVLLLEAYLNLSRHLAGSHERGVLDFYNQVFPNGTYRQEFTELVVLTEVLAHDLRWRRPGDDLVSELITADRLPAISAHAYNEAREADSPRTRRLGLPLVPTRLTFQHVRQVIQTVAAILRELRSTLQTRPEHIYVGASDFGRVEFHGQVRSFLQVADSL
jgi:hypothetical protein